MALSPSAIFYSPNFPPRFSIVLSRQRDRTVRRKLFDASKQEPNQSRQMREVTGDGDVARLGAETIANPVRRIVRLHVASRGEFRQRIARAPKRLSGLLGAQLSAVPDDRRPGAAGRRLGADTLGLLTAARRQRTARIDVRTDRVAVMDEIESQPSTLKAQLSRLKAQGSRLSRIRMLGRIRICPLARQNLHRQPVLAKGNRTRGVWIE